MVSETGRDPGRLTACRGLSAVCDGVEEVGDGQQIGASAGGEVSADHLPVQGLHRLRRGEKALGQQPSRLSRGPALALRPAPGDEVGIHRPGHQGQEDGYAGPLHADATLQQGAEGGQAGQQILN